MITLIGAIQIAQYNSSMLRAEIFHTVYHRVHAAPQNHATSVTY